MTTLIDAMFGLVIAFSLALVLSSLNDFDYVIITAYFTFLMSIMLFGGLIEFWMFILAFILLVVVVVLKYKGGFSNVN